MESSSTILREFLALTSDEKYHTLSLLLENTEVHQLKQVYDKVNQLLMFDCLTAMPTNLAEKVLSYLDVKSLCAASQCCQKWRELTNSDYLWYKHCQRDNYVKLESLHAMRFSQSSSPRHKAAQSLLQILSSSSEFFVCKWKMVYIKGSILKRHWRMGIYDVAPSLKGHRLPVTSIDCEKGLLVSGSSDNTGRIWSLESLECLHVLEGHTDAVNTVAIKGYVVVTACSDGVVRVYDAHSGQCIRQLHGHSGSVDHIAFDGNTAVSGGSDFSVRIWDVHKGKLIHTLTGHSEEIECVMFEGGSIALTGSWDCSLRVWDIDAGICKHILTGHTEVVYCCAYMPPGVEVSYRLFSGGGDALIKSWDLQTGDVSSMCGHMQEVLSIRCNERLIASASADSTVRIWAVKGSCMHVLQGHIGVVRCLYLKGNILISGGDRKRIIAWNIETGEELYTVHKQQSLLHRLCGTDTHIITASPDSPGTISVISYW